MVQPGVTLMTIVGEAKPTVTANFKETQIGLGTGPCLPNRRSMGALTSAHPR